MIARSLLVIMILGLIALGPIGWGGIISGSLMYWGHEKWLKRNAK